MKGARDSNSAGRKLAGGRFYLRRCAIDRQLHVAAMTTVGFACRSDHLAPCARRPSLANVDWQIAIYSSNERLRSLSSTGLIPENIRRIRKAVRQGKVTNKDYEAWLKDVLPCLKETAELLKNADLTKKLHSIESRMGPLRSVWLISREETRPGLAIRP
jgi:hypothetical protein